jgi:Na+-transporting methylmalonyl-CoA/oxaloacetate decarboxylase gamma subunit
MFIHLAQSAIAPENGGITDLLVYQLTGFLIVIIVLCSLWFAVSCLGIFFRNIDVKDPVAAPSPALKEPADQLEITPEVKAVIGAALHTVIKGPFRIVSVEESKSDQS